MLQLAAIQQDPQAVVTGLTARGLKDAQARVDALLALIDERRESIALAENLRAESNRIAKLVGAEMAKGNKEAAEAAKAQTQTLKQELTAAEARMAEAETAVHNALATIPNLPHASVPPGRSAEDNVAVRGGEGRVPRRAKPDPHWEIALQHKLIDWELGVKITGAGFPVYMGAGARLQRALIAFFLEQATAQGYREIMPPLMVNEASGFGTGQLPDKDGQMYHVTVDGLYLIPTAEVPVTNLYRDEIVDAADLPVKLCGYTPCFRREAGSYGKDVRGLNRLHQFDKVEIVQIADPEHSYEILEEMTAYVETLLQALELKYRVLALCAGDMGFTSAKTYDMEVYSPGQDMWLEVSSISNFESYQANRLKLRIRKPESKKPQLAHTLNGSALALPRILAALLEQGQAEDGGIELPAALHPFFGAERIAPVA